MPLLPVTNPKAIAIAADVLITATAPAGVYDRVVVWSAKVNGKSIGTMKMNAEGFLALVAPGYASKPATFDIRTVAKDGATVHADCPYTPAASTKAKLTIVQRWSIGTGQYANYTPNPLGMGGRVHQLGFAGIAKSATDVYEANGWPTMVMNPGGLIQGTQFYMADQLQHANKTLKETGVWTRPESFITNFINSFEATAKKNVPVDYYDGTLNCPSLKGVTDRAEHAAISDGLLSPFRYVMREQDGLGIDGCGAYADGEIHAEYLRAKRRGGLRVIAEGYPDAQTWLEGADVYCTRDFWQAQGVRHFTPITFTAGKLSPAKIGTLYLGCDPFNPTTPDPAWTPESWAADNWPVWHRKLVAEAAKWSIANGKEVKLLGDPKQIEPAMKEVGVA